MIFLKKMPRKCLRNDNMYHRDAMGRPRTATVARITWNNMFYNLKLRWELLK